MERLKYAPTFIRDLFKQEAGRESDSWRLFCYQAGRAVTGVDPLTPKGSHWTKKDLAIFIHAWLEKFPKKSPSQKKVGLLKFREGFIEGIGEMYYEGNPKLANGIFSYDTLYRLETAKELISARILPDIGIGSKKGQKALAGFADIYMKSIYPVVPFDKIMPLLSIPVWMNIKPQLSLCPT